MAQDRPLFVHALCNEARVDVRHVLDHGGNLIDAAALASIAALLNYRRPDVTVGGEGEITVHPLSEREPVPLSIHHVRPTPIHLNPKMCKPQDDAQTFDG